MVVEKGIGERGRGEKGIGGGARMGRDELKDYVGLSPPHAHLEKGAMVAGITIDDKLEGEALYNRTDIYNSDNDYNKIQMLRRRQR